MMPLYRLTALAFFFALASSTALAKWDKERDVSINGKDELVYYYKTNNLGQKLVLDKYLKRLIFIQSDRLYKRTIRLIKLDGVAVEVMSDPFARFPEQTAITFENKDEVMKKLFFSKKIEVYVRYNRDDSINTFQIQ
jgi:hypothetical protein